MNYSVACVKGFWKGREAFVSIKSSVIWRRILFCSAVIAGARGIGGLDAIENEHFQSRKVHRME